MRLAIILLHLLRHIACRCFFFVFVRCLYATLQHGCNTLPHLFVAPPAVPALALRASIGNDNCPCHWPAAKSERWPDSARAGTDWSRLRAASSSCGAFLLPLLLLLIHTALSRCTGYVWQLANRLLIRLPACLPACLPLVVSTSHTRSHSVSASVSASHSAASTFTVNRLSGLCPGQRAGLSGLSSGRTTRCTTETALASAGGGTASHACAHSQADQQVRIHFASSLPA